MHHLFVSCISNFNQQRKYAEVREQIQEALEDEYYKNAIEKCFYSDSYRKGTMALFILRHRYIFLLKILWMLKRVKLV